MSDEGQGKASSIEIAREASRLLAMDDRAEALAVLAPAVSDNTALEVRFVLGLAAWHLDRLDWSLRLLTECHDAAPMNGTVAEVLASLYAQAGDLIESLFMGKLAIALGDDAMLKPLVPADFPSFDRAFLSIKDRPLLAEAKLQFDKGKLAEAVEKARQHVELNGADIDGRQIYASMLLRAGNPAEAVEILQPLGETPKAAAQAASAYGQALAAVGESVAARVWHGRACDGAPQDPAIFAACVADGPYIETDAQRVGETAADWVARFAPARKPPRWLNTDGALVIAYLVADFLDRRDAAAVAAVARSHDRGNVRVIGYGVGAQSWTGNTCFGGAFDKWRDVALLEPATLARTLAGDDVQVVVDATGFAGHQSLLALPRMDRCARVSWLGNPGGVGEPLYDAQIAPEAGPVGRVPLWRIAGGYPLVRDWNRSLLRAASPLALGADVSLAQLDHDTVAAWCAILDRLPELMLVLRANELAHSANIARLVALFGTEHAARIDIFDAPDAESFYAKVDVALMPRRGVSPRVAAEATACGVPCVALAGSSGAEPYGGLLHGLGLGPVAVAADWQGYAARALALAGSYDARAEAKAAIAALGDGNAAVRRFAAAIEAAARSMLGQAAAA